MPRIRKDKMARSYAEPFWKIGLYIRLSREDDNEDESESVINQEKILRDFVDSYFEPGTYVIVDVFADDGLTGTDTARPNFKRLEGCIVRKEVNCMIIKSLARGFRNLADQQKFLEEFIPINGARFICTGTPFIDTYANPHSASGLEVPIRGMFNEQFAAISGARFRAAAMFVIAPWAAMYRGAGSSRRASWIRNSTASQSGASSGEARGAVQP